MDTTVHLENCNIDMTDNATLAMARAAEALAIAIGEIAKRDQSSTKYGLYIEGNRPNIDEEMLFRVLNPKPARKRKGASK